MLGKTFADGGLRDLIIESEVLAEGSVDRALKGKMCNRTVTYIKIIDEAINRILLDKLRSN